MGLEAGNFLEDLNVNNPDGALDTKAEGDDHIRLIKKALKQTFPGFGGRFRREIPTSTGTKAATIAENGTLLTFNTVAGLVNFNAAATLGNGWECYVYADGVTVTLDPNGTELINGVASLQMVSGQLWYVHCNGVSFKAVNLVNPDLTSLQLNNTGLQVKDTDASHHLTLKPGSNLTADRVFTLVTGDADRTLDVEKTVPGKTAVPIPASGILPRFTNGCTPMQTLPGSSNQPDVLYLAFDATAKEFAGFIVRMPKGWNEGTVTASFAWRRASGVGAANVVWGIRAVAVADDGTPAVGFGSEATVTDAASTIAAENVMVSAETGPCTIAGAPGEEELVFFEVFRDSTNVADTLEGVEAWLLSVTLYLTMDAHNDA